MRTRGAGLPLPLTIFSGAAMTTAPVGGSRSRLHRLARPNLPAPCMMVWLGNGGIERARLPGVSADRLDAHAEHVALVAQEGGRRRVEARAVGAIVADVQKVVRIGAAAPAGAQQHPRARGNAPVLRLPSRATAPASAGSRDRCRPRLVTSITHAGPDEAPGRNRVAGVVGQILAGDPVDGRVEVRARVLAEVQACSSTSPVPCSS